MTETEDGRRKKRRAFRKDVSTRALGGFLDGCGAPYAAMLFNRNRCC